MGNRQFIWRFMAACGLASALWCAPAFAVQHLIRDGEDWQHLGSRLRPGDQIILMPGQHRGAAFDAVIGTAQRPITIRSADPKNPSTIIAGREGIRVRNAAHLIIKDLIITGASVNGISLSGGETPLGDDSQSPRGDILVRNVTITKTGPRGLRHGISIQGLENVRIEECHIEGWGGSGIEIVACDDVRLTRCKLTGLTDHGQTNGIRVRAGSSGVEISECRIENPGVYGICLGGASDLEEFKPSAIAGTKSGFAFEAAQVRVQQCTIIGGQCAIGYIHADECQVQNTTIIRPRQCVFALLVEQTDARFSSGKRNFFGRNLVAWEAGDLVRLAEVSPKVDATQFSLDANLWWSPESPEQRDKLGTLPGKQILPQVVDVDPKLDSNHKPTDPQAESFGT